MANAFDEFDAPKVEIKTGANAFDEFDAPGLGQQLARQVGLAGRAVVKGATLPLSLVADPITEGINLLTGRQDVPLSQAVETGLTAVGFPEPRGAVERVVQDVGTAVTGAGATIRGAQALTGAAPRLAGFLTEQPTTQAAAALGGAGAAGTAREAGLDPLVQAGLGLAGGLAGGRVAQRGVTRPRAIAEAVEADSKFISAVEPVKGNFATQKRIEGRLWQSATEAGKETKLTANSVKPIRANVEASLIDDTGLSLNDDILSGLRTQVSKFDALSNLKRPINLSEVISVRKGVSSIAGKHPDGQVRFAAGSALRNIDEHLEGLAEQAVLNGKREAIDEVFNAIQKSKELRVKFGTNRKTGQQPLFENIITRNEVDNTQLVDAFGTTSRGNKSTFQLIDRLLKNSGDNEELVRSNIAKGYLSRAISKSLTNVDGEDVILPRRLNTELGRLLSSGRTTGGIGSDIRNLVFTPQEIAQIKTIKDGIKTPGALKVFLRELPVVGRGGAPAAELAAARSTKKALEKGLTDFGLGLVDELKGTPVNYGAILTGTAIGIQGEQ